MQSGRRGAGADRVRHDVRDFDVARRIEVLVQLVAHSVDRAEADRQDNVPRARRAATRRTARVRTAPRAPQ